LPLELFTLVTSRRIGAGDWSVMLFVLLRAAHPGVDFNYLIDLAASKSHSNLATDAIAAYRFDAKKARLIVPRDFRTEPPQQHLDQIMVPATSKLGGVLMPEPLSVAVMTGVGAN
jgi:hypothetical protein